MRRLITLSFVLAISGCGVDHEDLCERLDEECGADIKFDDCVQDGQRVEDAADKNGCDDQLDDYLDCLDEDICLWENRCDAERSALEACSGALPTF